MVAFIDRGCFGEKDVNDGDLIYCCGGELVWSCMVRARARGDGDIDSPVVVDGRELGVTLALVALLVIIALLPEFEIGVKPISSLAAWQASLVDTITKSPPTAVSDESEEEVENMVSSTGVLVNNLGPLPLPALPLIRLAVSALCERDIPPRPLGTGIG